MRLVVIENARHDDAASRPEFLSALQVFLAPHLA
jgi:hypothetical protein